ncbi:GNAT family N-acetyltransferase [Entomohabitans teleogrylli]|uniref:GNAT family N-acetyltransferase n=1 Tax=Entomohabitans teleogrylli TaxID=1384589 RepID=UPI00073D3484|nr:GNAT family N-acetyltransferase [Entomohabitans teleogrylli]
MTLMIKALQGAEILQRMEALNSLLIDCVEQGASVSFMLPMTVEKAAAFWKCTADAVARGERQLLVAEESDGQLLGAVQLQMCLPENQPHRAEVAKLLVHSRARRRGVANTLMRRLEEEALAAGKYLLVLDTATGSGAEGFYQQCGWQRVGVIPDFALMPDGARSGTTIYFKSLRAD